MSNSKRIFFETQEVVTKNKKGYIDVDMDYFQFYHKAFRYIASLDNSCSKDFILWVMTKVNNENEFVYSKQMLEDFNKDLSKIICPTSYSVTAMMTALKELITKKMVIKDSRSHYKVNPEMFWTSTEEKRIKAINNVDPNHTMSREPEVVAPEKKEEVQKEVKPVIKIDVEEKPEPVVEKEPDVAIVEEEQVVTVMKNPINNVFDPDDDIFGLEN